MKSWSAWCRSVDGRLTAAAAERAAMRCDSHMMQCCRRPSGQIIRRFAGHPGQLALRRRRCCCRRGCGDCWRRRVSDADRASYWCSPPPPAVICVARPRAVNDERRSLRCERGADCWISMEAGRGCCCSPHGANSNQPTYDCVYFDLPPAAVALPVPDYRNGGPVRYSCGGPWPLHLFSAASSHCGILSP